MDVSRSQIVGKSAGCWRCNVCNTRGVQLSRLPQWKCKGLKGFSKEEREEFWKKTHECDSPEKLVQLLTKREVTRHVESKHTAKNGAFLPLSVYKQRGFNTKRIKKFCTNKKWFKELGWCYNVGVESSGSLTKDEKEQEEEMKAQETVHGSEAASSSSAGGGAGGPNEIPKLVNTGNAKKDIGTATKILAKLATIMAPLSAVLKSKHCSKLPEFAIKAAEKCASDLKSMEQNAQKVIKGAAALEFSLQQCNEQAPR